MQHMTRFAFDAVRNEALKAIEAEGLRPFARRTGLAIGVVRSLQEGRDVSISNALEIAKALSYDVRVMPKKFSFGFREDASGPDLADRNALRSGYLPLPWHPNTRLKGSCPFAISADWLIAAHLEPDYLQALVPDFFSASFGHAKNTVAIIQTNADRSGLGDMWAFNDGTSIRIARIVFVPDAMIILADENDEPASIRTKRDAETFILLGRVVWVGMLINA